VLGLGKGLVLVKLLQSSFVDLISELSASSCQSLSLARYCQVVACLNLRR